MKAWDWGFSPKPVSKWRASQAAQSSHSRQAPPGPLSPMRWDGQLSMCCIQIRSTMCTQTKPLPAFHSTPCQGEHRTRSHQFSKMYDKPMAQQGANVAISPARDCVGRCLLCFSGTLNSSSSTAWSAQIFECRAQLVFPSMVHHLSACHQYNQPLHVHFT